MEALDPALVAQLLQTGGPIGAIMFIGYLMLRSKNGSKGDIKEIRSDIKEMRKTEVQILERLAIIETKLE